MQVLQLNEKRKPQPHLGILENYESARLMILRRIHSGLGLYQILGRHQTS